MNPEQPSTTEQTHPPMRPLRRLAWWFFGSAMGLWSGFLILSLCMVEVEAHGFDNKQKETIAPGAQERWLGPENAPGAVLFVHGFVGGANNFSDVPDALAARGWRVQVMRLPGHGTSPKELAKTTPEQLLQAVLSAAKDLQSRHPKLVLVGHSMGGALATLAAAEVQPHALVLAAPYFGVTHHWYYGLRPEQWVRLTAPVVPYVYKGKLFLQVNRQEAKDNIYSYTWIPSKGFVTLVALGKQVNEPAVLSKITCPVLWLHAPQDPAASCSAAQRAFDQMPSAQKTAVSLPKSSHHIFWDYDAVQVSDAVLNFVGTP